MANVYRGRLVSKNQMTIPVQMQRDLRLAKGDELEFVVENGSIVKGNVLKPVPVNLLPNDVLEALLKRRDAGGQLVLSSEETRRLAEEGEIQIKDNTVAAD